MWDGNYEEMTNEELLTELKEAIGGLPGGGAKARSFYYKVYSIVLERMGVQK